MEDRVHRHHERAASARATFIWTLLVIVVCVVAWYMQCSPMIGLTAAPIWIIGGRCIVAYRDQYYCCTCGIRDPPAPATIKKAA